MKRITSILLFIIVCISLKAQVSDSILYIFPDIVEKKLDYYISSSKAGDSNLFFVLENAGDNKYRIFVSSYTKSDYWENVSKRYGVVNETRYPLLFDYDYIFSTPRPSHIGTFGERDKQILKYRVILDGYSITFDYNGYMKESWGIGRRS